MPPGLACCRPGARRQFPWFLNFRLRSGSYRRWGITPTPPGHSSECVHLRLAELHGLTQHLKVFMQDFQLGQAYVKARCFFLSMDTKISIMLLVWGEAHSKHGSIPLLLDGVSALFSHNNGLKTLVIILLKLSRSSLWFSRVLTLVETQFSSCIGVSWQRKLVTEIFSISSTPGEIHAGSRVTIV